MEGMGLHVAETGIRLKMGTNWPGASYAGKTRVGGKQKRLVSSLCVMHTKGGKKGYKTDDLGERLTI